MKQQDHVRFLFVVSVLALTAITFFANWQDPETDDHLESGKSTIGANPESGIVQRTEKNEPPSQTARKRRPSELENASEAEAAVAEAEKVTVRTINQSGEPIRQVHVALHPNHGGSSTGMTDESGTVILPFTGNAKIIVRRQGTPTRILVVNSAGEYEVLFDDSAARKFRLLVDGTSPRFPRKLYVADLAAQTTASTIEMRMNFGQNIDVGSVETDDDGRFQLSGFSKGSSVNISLPSDIHYVDEDGKRIGRRKTITLPADSDREVSLHTTQIRSILGRCVSESRIPLQDVKVYISHGSSPPNFRTTVKTDRAGRFLLPIKDIMAAQSIDITTSFLGGTNRHQIGSMNAKILDCGDLTVPTAGGLNVVALDEQGAMCTDAIGCILGSSEQIESDRMGVIRLERLPALMKPRIVVCAPGHQAKAIAEYKRSETVTVNLDKGIDLRISVVDGEQLIPGVAVRVTVYHVAPIDQAVYCSVARKRAHGFTMLRHSKRSKSTMFVRITNENGIAEFCDIPVGSRVVCKILGMAGVVYDRKEFKNFSKEVNNVVLKMEKRADLFGIVKYHTGEAVPFARVDISNRSNSASLSVNTDAQGKFSILAIGDDLLDYRIFAENAPPTAVGPIVGSKEPDGLVNLVLRQPVHGRIQVEFADTSEQPIANVEVMIPGWGTAGMRRVVNLGDGLFEARALPIGNVSVYVSVGFYEVLEVLSLSESRPTVITIPALGILDLPDLSQFKRPCIWLFTDGKKIKRRFVSAGKPFIRMTPGSHRVILRDFTGDMLMPTPSESVQVSIVAGKRTSLEGSSKN